MLVKLNDARGGSPEHAAPRPSLCHWVAGIVGVVLALAPFIADPALETTVIPSPYVPAYPHQAQGYALIEASVEASARAWLAAAEEALRVPERVTLPLAAAGELDRDRLAAGFAFSVSAGRRLRLLPAFAPHGVGEAFVDVFAVRDGRYQRIGGSLPRAPLAALTLDAIDAGDYVLRVQAAPGVAGHYDLRVTLDPLLAFPVRGQNEQAIWSGFGADRDGGRRAHRGIDIFAARGTPVLAGMDAWVTRVETTRIGGNVVWLQPLFGNLRLYYAHLDEQWVGIGDFVRSGDPLGAVGNTGNAVTTPPHLHFGVYVREPGMRGGARDPADYIR
jgi:murein DD-endopeptidase MepM/ murein hydrolase activator NlpD